MRATRASAELGPSPVRWEMEASEVPVVAVAVHTGHALRGEVEELSALTDQQRLREEDPGTEVLARAVPVRGIGVRSRFEVDLNRPRAEAVHLDPGAAWGLEPWTDPPPHDVIERSLRLHDRFYRQLTMRVTETIRAHGSAVVLDLHSYNHRRNEVPEDPIGAPEVNVGTGSLDRRRWGSLVDTFIGELSTHGLDVRENVRFKGREVARFVNARYFGSACCLAVEFKKTYMNEMTGDIDLKALERLQRALASTLPKLRGALAQVADRAS